LYDQEASVKAPRFRIAWIMFAVALAAVHFWATRALFQPGVRGYFLFFGALPMADVLLVAYLIARQHLRSRPFLLGFEVFGAIALTLYISLATSSPRDADGLIVSYLGLVFDHWKLFNWGYGYPGHPLPEHVAIGLFQFVPMLVGPQLVFALIGGFLSRRFKISVTRR
jgi:hypothetical protein